MSMIDWATLAVAVLTDVIEAPMIDDVRMNPSSSD